MIPGNQLTTAPFESPFIYQDSRSANLLIDYEQGGVALNDASQGLDVKLWTLEYIEPNVTLSASGVSPTVLFSRFNISEVSLAFDQNMRPFVAFVESGQAKFWWYDSTIPAAVFTNLQVDAVSPKCTLDDKRPFQSSLNDILLIYKRGLKVCMRVQRDRYATEYVLKDGVTQKLDAIGMGLNYRLQIRLQGK